jgi:hypothetical protein
LQYVLNELFHQLINWKKNKKKKNENIIQILHRDMHYSKNIKEKTNASPEAMNAEA